MRSQDLWTRAELLRAESRFKAAAPVYLRSAQLARREGRGDLQLKGWLGAVECFRSLGEFSKARPWATRAVKASRGNAAARAEALAAEGLVFRGLERYGHALGRLRQALEGYRRAGDQRGEAYCLWGMGGCERFRGNPEAALGYFQRSAAQFKAYRDLSGWAYAMYGAGGALRVLGHVRQSWRNYRVAWQRCDRYHDRFGLAYGYCGMAHAYRKRAEFRSQRTEATHQAAGDPWMRKAETWYRLARELYVRIGDWSSVGYTTWGLGQAALAGKKGGAEKHFRLAYREFQKAHDTRGMALARLGIAQSSGSAREVERAWRWARRRGLARSALQAY